MIRQLRLKVVAVCMLLVTAVLAGVFSSLYLTAREGIQNSSEELLQRVVSSDPRLTQGSEIIIGGSQVQLPYFTVELWGERTAYVTGGTYPDLEDTALLAEILQACVNQGESQGVVDQYHLRYLRVDKGFYECIAFVDMSMELAALNNLVQATFTAGLGALLLLLGASSVLAWWVTRPVEQAWQRQRQFLSDASHELKTPLTVILSNAELMNAVAEEPRLTRWADNIRSEAERMKVLVEEMLTLARADSMPRTAVFSAVSLSAAATDCALLFEPVAFEAGKPLEYEDIDPAVTVAGDGDRLKQVVSVLLDNAIKYGASGAPITMTLHKTDRHARLQVANQGDPIPPEQRKRLFERFYRADASRGERSGFGLGLPIAAAITAEHKGVLRVESDEASTRFILTLPLGKPPAAALPPEAP